LAAIAFTWCSCALGDLRPINPICEYSANPLGVDLAQPHLGWTDEATDASARGVQQSAYEILVSSTPQKLADNQGDLWSSGIVKSNQNRRISYSGKPLVTAQAAFWKARVWDQNNKPSQWSAEAQWTSGVMDKADWKAQWIRSLLVPPYNDNESTMIGYHANEATSADDIKWVGVDLGKPYEISAVILTPMVHESVKGFGFPIRYNIEASSTPDFLHATVIADESGADYPDPGDVAVTLPTKATTARFVRVFVSKLWLYKSTYRFALQSMAVISAGQNVAAGAKVLFKDSVEAYGWGSAALTADHAKTAVVDSLLIRRSLTVKPKLVRAIAFVCGLGQYEMSVNGHKVGDDVLAPGWTKYDKTCLYDTRDITQLLLPGSNAIGLILGNGMYNVHGGRYTKFTGSFGPQKAICQIELFYSDGSKQIIGTDSSWKAAPGPITFSSIYGGEDYDARLLPTGWDESGLDDHGWENAAITDGPGGTLKGLSAAAPPIVITQTFKPASVKPISDNVTVYDFGQNAAFMPRLTVSGPGGSTVTMTPAELINADGSVDRESVGGGLAYWKYTLSGSGVESYFPKFFYQGCRYIQVELTSPAGQPPPTIKSLTADVIGSDSKPVGSFTCSNDLFNRTYALIKWAQRSNTVSVITDCPHRERLGWLEQTHLNGPALRYNYDLDQLFSKVENDMADSQTADGLIPDIAPEYPVFDDGFRDSPEWGSAGLLVPWQQYQFTGDYSLLSRYYNTMKAYVAYLKSKAHGDILSYGLGDWYDIGPNPPGFSQLTPPALTATAFYYQDALIMSEAARILGKPDDEANYTVLAGQIKDSFNSNFWNPKSNSYSTGSQTANAIPYVMGLADGTAHVGAANAIVQDISRRKLSFTAGDVGYRYLLLALAESGNSDIIFAMNNQSDKPGYGYQLKMGATSLTEAWDARPSSSQNHFMLGQINEWFFHDIGGIQDDPSSPGFSKIIIKPTRVGDITSAQTSYDSDKGLIATSWKLLGGKMTLDVTIPANTSATIYVPGNKLSSVNENRRKVSASPGVTFVKVDGAYAVYSVGSGEYHFTSNYTANN